MWCTIKIMMDCLYFNFNVLDIRAMWVYDGLWWRVQNAELSNVKTGGTYRYHFDLKHLISDLCSLTMKETMERETAELTGLWM